jgi:multicomponent Na+:H+ antiporter subunit D
VKANLFLVSGAAYRICGSYELKDLGGLYRSHPALSILFLIPALSLAGVPPLSGFFAKFMIIRAGVEIEAWPIVIVALLTGLLTLFSMVKIWAEAFWKPLPAEPRKVPRSTGAVWPLYLPIAGMAALTLMMGLWAQPIYELAFAAAAQMLDPSIYIEAVLGAR